jgi:hypothetical protein
LATGFRQLSSESFGISVSKSAIAKIDKAQSIQFPAAASHQTSSVALACRFGINLLKVVSRYGSQVIIIQQSVRSLQSRRRTPNK